MLPNMLTTPRFMIALLSFAAILFLIAFTSTATSASGYRERLTNIVSGPSASGSNTPASDSGSGAGAGAGAAPNKELRDKLALAERLWEQAVVDREAMASRMGYDKPFPDGYNNPFNIWDFARPSFFSPHDMERVGTLGDGGKVVCGMSRYETFSPGPSSPTNPARELVVYSFGVNDDSSFEAALLQRTNAQIWGYDYSVDKWAKHIPSHRLSRAHFKKAGIGKETDETKQPPFYNVQDLMKINGHDYVDVVKMDIEGYEYDALTSLVDFIASTPNGNHNGSLPFGQLLVEMHLYDGARPHGSPENIRKWMEWWAALEKLGLRPANNEDNWIGDVVYGKPRFMEVGCFVPRLMDARPLTLCSTP
jgi:hypothetical protein